MIPENFLLIALRYLFNKQQNKSIQSMIKVCFLGIALASCALTLVVSVMEGFEQATHEKMQSIYPDLILDSNHQSMNTDMLQPIIQEDQYHIQQCSPQKIGQALLYNNEYSSAPTVICLKGIIPEQEQLVNTLYKKIIQPTSNNSLATILQNNQILIGTKLAQQLNVSVGDEIQLLYTNDEPENLKVNFLQSPVIIGGIFKTGIEEFDTNISYSNDLFFEQLFPDIGTTQAYLKLKHLKYETETITKLKQRLNIDVYSWQSLYPALVSALKLEKYAMFFILLLIIIIASMNIISLIFMYITQKNKDIALFLSFGMPLKKVKMIFISISFIISFFATLSGLTIAYLIGKLIQIFPIINLPDEAYLITHLPIKLDPLVFCVIFMASILITLCATIISTQKLNDINITQALKYE